MNDMTVCNVCEKPGTLTEAFESAKVFSNVRAFGREAFTIWRCINCRSLHSKEAVDLQRYYENYPMRNQRLDFLLNLAFRRRLSLLKRHGLKTNHRVLDYGCSTGLFVSFMRAKGYATIGYDAFVDEYADQKVLESEFDVIVSQDVIEHVETPGELIYDCARYLKPGGMLLFGTPNANEISLSDAAEYSMELHQPYHRHILSEAALVGLCQNAGLKLETVSYRFFLDTPFPMGNTRFIKSYLKANGGYLDSAFEQPQIGLVLRSSKLLVLGILGYFLRSKGHIVCIFRK